MSADVPEIPPVTVTEPRCTAPPMGEYLSRWFVAGALFHSPGRLARQALLHAKRAAGLAGEELPDELVVGVEQLRRRAGLDDAALPQDRDVVRDAARRHDVVGDDDVAAAVLRVHL